MRTTLMTVRKRERKVFLLLFAIVRCFLGFSGGIKKLKAKKFIPHQIVALRDMGKNSKLFAGVQEVDLLIDVNTGKSIKRYGR
jgi:hypothetical protein